MILYILFLFFHKIKVSHDLSREFPINANNYGNTRRDNFKMKISNKIFKQKRGSFTSPYERNNVTPEQSLNIPIISDDIYNLEETITDKFIQIFTSAEQNIEDNTNVGQFIEDNTNIRQNMQIFTTTEQAVQDNTNIRQNMQIFTPTDQNMQIITTTEQAVQDNTTTDQNMQNFTSADQNMQIFTTTEQAVQDNTNIDQFIEDFINTEQFMQNFAPTDQNMQIFTPTEQAVQDNTNIRQNIEDNTNVGQFIEDNTNIRQNMQIFTTTDQNMQIFTTTEQAVQDNTNIRQFIQNFTTIEQYLKDYTSTVQIEKEKSSTQSNENVFIENKEEQNNLTISNSKIQEIAKKVINEQNIIFKDEVISKLATLKFEENLAKIENFAQDEDLQLLIDGYKKLYSYVQNEPVLSEVQILEVLNKAIEVSYDIKNFNTLISCMKRIYNKYKTLIKDNIPFLKKKILESSISEEEKDVFSIYFDYFDNIVTYILNYKTKKKLCSKTYAYFLYKYIRFMIQMPTFLSETNYKQIFDDFVKKVKNLKFEEECCFKNDLSMLAKFETNYSFVLQKTEERTETMVKCCAYILQNHF